MVTINRICVDCGKNISKLQPQCMRCKYCQKKFRLKYNRKSMLEKRKYKASRKDTELGTTDFNSHREKDFDKEAAAIKKEMEGLGLR